MLTYNIHLRYMDQLESHNKFVLDKNNIQLCRTTDSNVPMIYSSYSPSDTLYTSALISDDRLECDSSDENDAIATNQFNWYYSQSIQ